MGEKENPFKEEQNRYTDGTSMLYITFSEIMELQLWGENFQKFPSLYQSVRIDTIQIKKKQPELFRSRLQKLLDNTKSGIMHGEWNDNGRLLTD